MRKRFLAMLLCLCMVVTMLPIAAFAAGDGTLTALDISKGAITIGENTVSGIDSDGNNVTTVDEDGYVITGTASGGNAITINGQPADSIIQLGTASAPLNITGSGVILYITANAKNVNLRVAGNVTLTSSGSPTLPLKSSASIEIAENASLTLNGSSSPALMVEDSAALNITGDGSFTANYTGNSAFTISAQAGSFSCTVGGDIAITNTNNMHTISGSATLSGKSVSITGSGMLSTGSLSVTAQDTLSCISTGSGTPLFDGTTTLKSTGSGVTVSSGSSFVCDGALTVEALGDIDISGSNSEYPLLADFSNQSAVKTAAALTSTGGSVTVTGGSAKVSHSSIALTVEARENINISSANSTADTLLAGTATLTATDGGISVENASGAVAGGALTATAKTDITIIGSKGDGPILTGTALTAGGDIAIENKGSDTIAKVGTFSATAENSIDIVCGIAYDSAITADVISFDAPKVTVQGGDGGEGSRPLLAVNNSGSVALSERTNLLLIGKDRPTPSTSGGGSVKTADARPTTYTYNTPDSITENGVTAAVSFDKDSPQAADTVVTATVTLTGEAEAAGTHTINLNSTTADLTETAQNITVTAGQTAPTVPNTYTFTLPSDVDDLTLTHSFAEGALQEQFTLPVGESYWFDLSGAGIPGTPNAGNFLNAVSMPDTTLHYVPFTYAGTVKAYSRSEAGVSTGDTVTVSPRSLFMADYAVTHSASWNDLDEKDLIFGTDYTSGGVSYTLRAPSVGSDYTGDTGNGSGHIGTPDTNEWDAVLNKNNGYIKNWSNMISWGQDTDISDSSYRADRGYNSARSWWGHVFSSGHTSIGFRPVLEVLSPDTLTADGLKTATLNLSGGKVGSVSGELKIVYTGDTFTAPAKEGLTRPDGNSGTYFKWQGSNKLLYAPGDTVPSTVTALTALWVDTASDYTMNFSQETEVTWGSFIDHNFSAEDAVGTGWSWDHATKTLTLDNFDFATSQAEALILPGGATLKLNGESTVQSAVNGTIGDIYGIHVTGDLAVTGTGSLTVTGGNTESSGAYSYGVYAGGSVTIEGSTLTATGGNAINSGSSYGVRSGGGVTIEGGALTAKGSDMATKNGDRSYGVYAGGGVIVESGALTATGGAAKMYSYGVYADGSVTVESGTLTATGGKAGSSYGVFVYDGKIEVSGGTLTAASGEATLTSLALNKALTLQNGITARGSTANNGSNPEAYDPDKNDTYRWVQTDSTTYALTVDLNGGSGGTTGGDYAAGAPVNINAGTKSGYSFSGWTSSNGGTFDSASSASTTFTMPASDTTVTANWEAVSPTTYALTVNLNGGNGGTTGGDYAAGAPVNINAGTKSGYSFSGWTSSNGGTFDDASSASTTFTMPASDTTVTANWTYSGGGYTPPSYDYYTITATAGTCGSISPSGSVSVREGRDKSFTVTPNSGYVISDVLVDGVSVKSKLLNNTYTFENVYRNHTIRVTFIEESKVNPNTGVGNPFTDVKESDWFFDDVMFVYTNNLMVGTSDTTFSPNDTTTRAMVATILWRMEGSPEVTGSSGFTDVPEGKYYTDAITWAKQNDLVNGYSDTLFGPNDPVTREQLAAFFYRYAEFKDYDTMITASISSFGDSDKVSPWAVDAMKWAVGYGVIQGKTGNLLDPQGDATRAQLAAMLHRLIDKNELVEGVTTTGLMGWIDPRRLKLPNTGDMTGGAWPYAMLMLFAGGAIILLEHKRRARTQGA